MLHICLIPVNGSAEIQLQKYPVLVFSNVPVSRFLAFWEDEPFARNEEIHELIERQSFSHSQ